MKIRLIREFEAFDLVHTRQRNASTIVSLSLDGRRYYSLTLPGTRTISSGEDVVVAFEDEDENQIIGWVDPVSKELHSMHVSSGAEVFLMGILTSLIGFNILSYLRLQLPISIAIVCSILALAFF